MVAQVNTSNDIDNGRLMLQGEKVESIGKFELAQKCPACKFDYGPMTRNVQRVAQAGRCSEVK